MIGAEAEDVAAAHLWRCESIARKVTRGRPRDYEEAYSIALVALDEAIRTFDPSRHAPDVGEDHALGAHLQVTIRSRVVNALHLDRPKGYRTRMGLPRPEAPTVVALSCLSRRPPAIDPDEPPVGWAAEWDEEVLALSRKLPPRHGELLRCVALHADGQSAGGAARRMGLARGTVHHLYLEMLGMLREKARRSEILGVRRT